MRGIIIHITKVRETDAIVDVLTETDQVIHAYARNFRTSKKYPNGLELFSVYDMACTRAQEGRFWLNSAFSEHPFSGILQGVSVFASASAVLETISVAYAEESPMPNLFTTLLQALAAMEAAPELSVLVYAWLEARILYVQQIMPDMRLCAGCGEVLTKSSYFQQEQGFLCSQCAHGAENLASHVYSGLRRLVSSPMQAVLMSAVKSGDAAKRLSILRDVSQLMVACLRDLSARKTLPAHEVLCDTVFCEAGVADADPSE